MLWAFVSPEIIQAFKTFYQEKRARNGLTPGTLYTNDFILSKKAI